MPSRVATRPTLLRALLCGLFRAAMICGGFALGVLLLGGSDTPPRQSTPDNPPVRTTTTPAPSVEALLIAHDCWTGPEDMPADMKGKIPGGVIVTRDGETIHGGDRLVGLALEQMPAEFGGDGIDHGLRIHGFCRR